MNLPDFTQDIFGNPISFDGNTNIKRKNTQLNYTREHIQELIRCKDDIEYFAENYYYILNIDTGLTRMKIRDYQLDMIKSFQENRNSIVLSARQTGKSTSFEVFICHYILFNKDKKVAILANKAEQARDLLRKIKQAYELLPKWMQQGVMTWNTGSISLENGSSIITAATSSSGIRGKSISLLVIDEFAFIPKNVFDDFYSSVYPTISSGKESKVIFVSTPNGLNHFYQFWQDAIDNKNGFNPIRVDWWQVPGRNDKWAEETKLAIGLKRFAQEFGNDFQGSSDTLIDPDVIRNIRYMDQIEIPNLHNMLPKKYHKFLRVYRERKPDSIYAMGIDTAKTTKESSGDSSVIQILDITRFPYEQVAVFQCNHEINYLELPMIANTMGKYYNEAYAFVENNEIGQEVANILHMDVEYENVFFEKPELPGFRTTKRTKRVGLNNLKLLIENYKLVIHDFQTISELSVFIKNKDSYKAESGYHDDAVMSLVAALFFLQRAEFESFENSTVFLENLREQKDEQKEDEIFFGFLDDGNQDPFDDF